MEAIVGVALIVLVVTTVVISRQIARLSKATDRIEAAAAVVASDLLASHVRADAVGNSNHGAAADAAAQSEQKDDL
jgi:hypothetical protein